MTTGQRMKARRKEIGLSAEAVAERLGISPATIYRYENGDIDKVPGERLAPIAKALQTTPAYLMGWDNEKSAAPKDDGLSENEHALLTMYRALTPENQEKLMKMLRVFVETL